MQKLHDLITSIQSFDKKKQLRRTITRDDSVPNLSRISISHSIEAFDATSLKHVERNERRSSLYEEASKEVGDEEVFSDISLQSLCSDNCLEERNHVKLSDSELKDTDRYSSSSMDDIFDAMKAALGPCREHILEQNITTQVQNEVIAAEQK